MQSIDMTSDLLPTGHATGGDKVVSVRGSLQESTISKTRVTIPKITFGYCVWNDEKPKEKLQRPKGFNEDLSLIPLNDGDDNGGIRKEDFLNLKATFTPHSTRYAEGEVRRTTKDALVDMSYRLPGVKCDTGCIIDETCDPECFKYIEGIHFVSKKVLGHGSFGHVDLCYDSKTKKPFVRKQIQKDMFRANEVIAPTSCSHPNVTKFFGLVQRDSSENFQPATVELYLEYGGDSLDKIYLEGTRFNEKQIRNLAKQGLAGLAHMDKIVHLDLKPENVCIFIYNDDTMQLKLTDFGSSRMPSDRLEFVGQTPEYTAPEICQFLIQRNVSLGLNWGLKECDITGKVDVFAWALVIMYMYLGYHVMVRIITNGNLTYKNIDDKTKKMLRQTLMNQMAMDTDNDFFVQKLIPDGCSLNMRDLLMKMTEHNHVARATASQALELIEDDTEECTSLLIETGPVKNHETNLLRRKLYDKGGHHSKGPNFVPPINPQQEMLNLRQEIATSSKKIHMPTVAMCSFNEAMVPRGLGFQATAHLTQPSMEDTTPGMDNAPEEGLSDMVQRKTPQTAIPKEAVVQAQLINLPEYNLCHLATQIPMEESVETPGNLPHFQEIHRKYAKFTN